MKTHCCDRKSVALLAAGGLEPGSVERLRGHLAECPACREYLREVSVICADHARAADGLPEVSFPPDARERVRCAIGVRPGGGWRSEWRFLPGFSWAVRFGVVVILLALVGGAYVQFRRPVLRLVSPAPMREPSGPVVRPSHPVNANPGHAPGEGLAAGAPGSRLGDYRFALSRSETDFDRLLAANASILGGGVPESYHAGDALRESDL